MSAEAETPKVLVVEDDALIAEDLSEILREFGYEVVGLLDSGEDAIQQAGILKPDMVLMDIRLKKKVDGIEAAKEIFDKYRVPSVFLTAYADEETLKRVTDFGPFGYVLKPYQERELKAAIDIALRRNQTEKKLEQLKFNFQDIVGKMQDGVLIFDSASNVRFMNPSAKLVLGDNVQRIIQDLLADLLEKSLVKEIEVDDPEGNRRTFETKVAPYRWQGELVYLAALRDVTERKAEKLKAERAEKNIRKLIDSNIDAIVVIGEDGNVLFANPSAQKIFQRDHDDFVGHHFGFPLTSKNVTEVQVLQREGGPIIAEMRMVKTSWQGEPCYLASIRDVTEQRHLGKQLLQSQKMEAVGKLAGGVAHDFNNLLTVIKGYSEFLAEQFEHDEKALGFAQGILTAANRAASLTNQLLSFSRQQVIAPKVFDLNVLIKDMESMLRRLIDEGISFHSELEEEANLIKMDPGQMEQVVMNLVVNARDAMPLEGKILLKAKRLCISSSKDTSALGIPIGEYAHLQVSDTGSGIPKEIVGKIFDPFFTTKAEGKGTGLGLSTCFAIIKDAKGSIRVDSEQGKGTTFNIYVPISVEQKNKLISEQENVALPKGSETILLVEDEDELRKMSEQILVAQGYQVLSTSSGAKALDIIQQQAISPDLVITDVVMPVMNGRQLVESIREKFANVKALFISGYTDDTVFKNGVFSNEINFLHKPFGKNSLAFKVREVLDK